MTQTRRVASPAEVLICGNAGIRKGLGASSRSTELPQRPDLESLFLLVPRRVLKWEGPDLVVVRFRVNHDRALAREGEAPVRPVVKTRVTSPVEREMQVRILPRDLCPRS